MKLMQIDTNEFSFDQISAKKQQHIVSRILYVEARECACFASLNVILDVRVWSLKGRQIGTRCDVKFDWAWFEIDGKEQTGIGTCECNGK